MDIPLLLALDFDGVLCDGMLEYFQSSKRTYLNLWPEEDSRDLDSLAPQFYQLRPLIETGWEMPLLLRAIAVGIDGKSIKQNWQKYLKEILSEENLEPRHLAEELDRVRDNWIATDLDSWLSLHCFYPGVIKKLEKLLESPIKTYIITTKEGRFAKQLLGKEGIDFADDHVIGKEVKRPKAETIWQLLNCWQQPAKNLWFVEDLLKSLTKVQAEADLEGVGLFLADWGYNTQEERDSLVQYPAIHRLSLEQFSQDCREWVRG